MAWFYLSCYIKYLTPCSSYTAKIQRALMRLESVDVDDSPVKLKDTLEAAKSHLAAFNKYFSLYSLTSAIGRRLACFMQNEASKSLLGADECMMASESVKGFAHENKRLYCGSNKMAAAWVSAADFRKNKSRFRPYSTSSRYFPRSRLGLFSGLIF